MSEENIISFNRPVPQSVADREGRKCLFVIKCIDRSFEISASDKKKKQEWIQGLSHSTFL